MKYFIKIILMVLLFGATLFSKDIATVTGLSGNAFLQRDAQRSELSLGERLQEKDSVITNVRSKVQIVFEDETIVTVGRNSTFSIKEYLFSEDEEPVVKFGMLKGAMRTITGKIGKIAPDRFSVITKTATIGIRGTNFTIIAREDGSQNVYCTYGAISVMVNGQEIIVRQGYYVDILASGAMQLKEFSAKELKVMQKNNFGDSKTKDTSGGEKSEGSYDNTEDTGSSNNSQIDTTRDDSSSNVVVKDVSDDVVDAEQTEEEDDDDKCSDDHDEHYPYPEADLLMGTVSDDIENSYSNFLMFQVLSPGNFNSDTSFLRLTNVITTTGEIDLWDLYLAPTATRYISKEDFTVAFQNFYHSPSGSTTNPRLIAGSLVATDDDLQSGDYMSWGSWNATLGYTDSNSIDQVEDLSGLWVAGEVTDSAIVEAKTGQISYHGDYKAVDFSANNTIITGFASMYVDFGADTASLYLEHDTSGRSFDMTISGSFLSGSQVNGNGEAYGWFYGPNGNYAGGNFATTLNGSMELKGVYQVTNVAP